MNWTDYNFLPITEKSAIESSFYIGKLDKYTADDVATKAMREELNKLPINATVVIGEGEMDEAPMLYIGEELGSGGDALDIAVDPLDGTNLTSKGQNNAITVIALGDKDGFLKAPDMYMKKIAGGAKAKGVLNIKLSLKENLRRYAKSSQKDIQDITVAMLDRDRHEDAMKDVLEEGACLKLLSDGDVLPGILTALEENSIDILYGIGAAPEGVITAAALKALGGEFQGILIPENAEQEERCKQMGIKDVKTHVFSLDELVSSKNIVVCLTAVTDGFMGEGVKKGKEFFTTNSLQISSSSPKIKYVRSFHLVK